MSFILASAACGTNFASFSFGGEPLCYLWEAAAEAAADFGGGGLARRQTAGPAVGKAEEPGAEH